MGKYLTKSLFTHALECPSKLYYKTHPETYQSSEDDNEFLMALAEGGMQVGELAKHYYPGGIDIPYSKDKQTTLSTTSTLLEQVEVIIYEAAINFGRTYALVDILKKEGNTLHLIEVKSKSWDAHEGFYTKKGAIDKQWHKYLYDVAFQTWVAQKAFPGYHIKPYLMLIDKNKSSTVDGLHQYFKVVKDENGRSSIELSVAPEELELGNPILTTVDCETEVSMIFEGTIREPRSALEAQGFEQWVLGLIDLLDQEVAYPIEIGEKCKRCEHRVSVEKLEDKTCGFNECWKKALRWSESDLGKPHMFDIWFSPTKKLLRDNIYFMEEVTPTWLAVNETSLYQQPAWDHGRSERQLAQVMKMTGRHDASEVILPGLYAEMDTWTYPLHFIDFEGIAPAIPFHKGMYPYKKTPFQFSVHDVAADGTVTHAAEWVETELGCFLVLPLFESSKKVLENDGGSVFMYHHYERTTLNDVKAMLQRSSEQDKVELIDFIDSLVDDESPRRLIDQQKLVLHYYYSVHMKGSNSIKQVLPAVLTESEYLQQVYSQPYSGLSIKDSIFYKADEDGKAINPYKLLAGVGLDDIPDPLDIEDAGMEDNEGTIADGGTAMMAWARMQFEDIPEAKKAATFKGLLRYCELDTLAMVMIYQHWESMRGRNA